MVTEICDSSSISLYFDVPHNEAVSLEAISRASLAWSGLIKELASVADPSSEIRVDFLSGTVGSRSINSIITATKSAAIKHPLTAGSLGALAGVFLLAPVNHLADDATVYLAKEWLGHEDDSLTDTDVERVAQRVYEMQRNRNAQSLRSEVYSAGESDSRVRGIGAAPRIQRPPDKLIMPRSNFEAYHEVYADEPMEVRTTFRLDQRVTIVRPYSKGEERRWRFEGSMGEFSATMRDPAFLEALRSRHTGIEIGENIHMRLDLRVKEELVNGEWVEKEFDVVRVIEPDVRLQSSLEFAPDKPDKPNQ